MRRCNFTCPPCIANSTRLITSPPCRDCAFSAVCTASTAPVRISSSCATIVVLPRSMAMPSPARGVNANTVWSERIAASHCAISSSRSAETECRHARRQPPSSSAAVSRFFSSAPAGRWPFSTFTRQPLQRPRPPQGNSTPCSNSTSCKRAPGGTSSSRPAGESLSAGMAIRFFPRR